MKLVRLLSRPGVPAGRCEGIAAGRPSIGLHVLAREVRGHALQLDTGLRAAVDGVASFTGDDDDGVPPSPRRETTLRTMRCILDRSA
jgi:hypothetical protein